MKGGEIKENTRTRHAYLSCSKEEAKPRKRCALSQPIAREQWDAGILNGIGQTYITFIMVGDEREWRGRRSYVDYPLSVINDICSEARKNTSGHFFIFFLPTIDLHFV